MGQQATKFAEVTNDYELVIRVSKELEYILEQEFGAHGRGLHEKISSCNKVLPVKLIKDMRYLATIRNNLIHQRGFDAIPDRNGFIQVFERSVTTLESIRKENGRSTSSCIIS